MHESIFANQIMTEARRHGNVKSIKIEVGELAAVPAKDLVQHLQRAVPWQIEFTEKPSIVKCKCGFKGHPTVLERGHDFFFIECPKCKEMPEIQDGQDIKLISVEVK